VNSYLYRKYGAVLVGRLKENLVEQRELREKQKFKEQMWSKVSGWLGDIEKK